MRHGIRRSAPAPAPPVLPQVPGACLGAPATTDSNPPMKSLVDALARRIAGVDKQTIADIKRLVDASSLPTNGTLPGAAYLAVAGTCSANPAGTCWRRVILSWGWRSKRETVQSMKTRTLAPRNRLGR